MKKKLTLRERIFYTFDEPHCSHSANLVSLLVLASIVLSSASMILETLPTSRVDVLECEGAQVCRVPVQMRQG